MTPEEQRIFDDATQDYYEGLDEMHNKNAEFLENIKKQVNSKCFKHIEYELEESGTHGNYRIVDKPTGEPQHDTEDGYTYFVDQHCGCCEDDYYGTICFPLPNGKFCMWNYSM